MARKVCWLVNSNFMLKIIIFYQITTIILMLACSSKFENTFKEKGIALYGYDPYISLSQRMWFMRKIMFYMLLPIYNLHVLMNTKNIVERFVDKEVKKQ